ncbi:MAG: FeoB-associated Cys-rich membrane protein [Oscillospiraceae bacterium]
MLEFLMNNLSTIIVGAVILAIIILIIMKIRRDKKSGKTCAGCGCGCENCPSSSKCDK